MVGSGRLSLALAALGFVACGPQVELDEDSGATTGGDDTTGAGPTGATIPPGDETVSDSVDPFLPDLPPTDLPPPGCEGDCSASLDLLIVVDNSANMARAQATLAATMARLVGSLETFTDVYGNPVDLDVQVMVTTTDVGNPLCTAFQPPGYQPAVGAPTTVGCNQRIDDFIGLTDPPITVPWACTSVCPDDVDPADPFVAFAPGRSNVPDVPPLDIDGDGIPESAAARAVACLVPQGINGCGHEAPLEGALQAIEPAAPWNAGARPFLRDDAALGIVILTDEADCSVDDFGVMTDPAYREIDPETGMPGASSAICFHAGVQCDGPDPMGLYSNCTVVDGPLQPLARYTDYLGYLRDTGKEVFMVAVTGVPTVTSHDAEPPFQPISGGALGLLERTWIDGPFPAGDIFGYEWAAGVTAAHKQFQFGIGPACTGEELGEGNSTQAVPSHRLMEVCGSLDFTADDGSAQVRCAIESICDPTYDGLLPFVQATVSPVPSGF